MINNLLADFAESSEGSEGGSDQDVLGFSCIFVGVLNMLGRADVEKLKVSLDFSVALFKVLKSLGNVFLEFSDLGL